MSLESVTVARPHGAMAGAERLLTLANLGAAHVTLQLAPDPPGRALLVSSSDPDRATGEVDPDRFILLPGETVVLLVGLGGERAP